MLVWSIVSTLVIGLLSLLVVVRLLGKKSLSSLTPFDFVYTLVLGGIVEESLYDDAVTIWHLLLAIVLWAAMIYFVEWISHKNERINKWMKGEPAVVVVDGKPVIKEINNNNLEMEQIRQMLRLGDCYSLRNAQYAVLETGGQMSVMTKDDEDRSFSLLVVDEGMMKSEVLENWKMNEDQVKKELAQLGHENIEDILYAEWTRENGFYVVRYEDAIDGNILVGG